jgi:hypothetical protein
MVRPKTHRLGRTSNTLAHSYRLAISTSMQDATLAKPLRNCGPRYPAAGEQLRQERMQPKHRYLQHAPAIAVLGVGSICDGVQQQNQCVYEDVALLVRDFLACIVAGGNVSSYLGALHALAVDDGRRRADFALTLFAAGDIERMMNVIRRAIQTPHIEIVEQHTARRQVFGDCPLLAGGAEDVHDTVHHRPHIDMAPISTPLGR